MRRKLGEGSNPYGCSNIRVYGVNGSMTASKTDGLGSNPSGRANKIDKEKKR